MSWYSYLSDAFKKRAGRYIINRYLGTFLEEGILLDQLSVEGAISLRDVNLNIKNINAMMEDSELPVELVDGYIQELSVDIPWANLLNENCYFEISGLTITMQVKKREHPTQISASIFYSMCESFSSMSMAEECLKQHDVTDSPSKRPDPEERLPSAGETASGVEILAQAIDSIAMRVQVKLTNTTFRLEYVPTVEARGLALELKVGKAHYKGEMGQNTQASREVLTTSTVKRIFFEDVSLFSDEFTYRNEILTESVWKKDSPSKQASADESEEPPLKLAALTGKQELQVRFTETNQFGLPRSIEDIELNLGGLVLHVFPHQIHTLLEIITAITVPAPSSPDPSSSSARPFHFPTKNVEGLLQESMMIKPVMHVNPVAGGIGAWGMSHSSEFHEMQSPKLSGGLSAAAAHHLQQQSVPVPKITVKAVYFIGAFVEKDEGLSKLGGESSKKLAMSKMRSMAFNYFESTHSFSPHDKQRLEKLHAGITNTVHSSHVQLVGSPLSITYEEGTAYTTKYEITTTVTVGQLSLREVLLEDNVNHLSDEVKEIVHLATFDTSLSSSPFGGGIKTPDIKVVYKEVMSRSDSSQSQCNINVSLNPCIVDFDPGFVDRTYVLLNYAELDPQCLRTVTADARNLDAPSPNSPKVVCSVTCDFLKLHFHIPKPDMRNPADIPCFASTFWSRKIHPELIEFLLKDFGLTVTQETSAPLQVGIKTNAIEVNFQEFPNSEKLTLVRVRQSAKDPSRQIETVAASISITVCLDDSQKLQGKFSTKNLRSSHQPSSRGPEGMESGSFFVTEGGDVSSEKDSNSFLKQVPHIQQALQHGCTHNNLLINLMFDDISLLIPSKHIYEVIYNRLGNDMLLWLPEIFRVKEFLYNMQLFDPLRKDDHAFSDCFSGMGQLEDHHTKKKKEFVSFPRSDDNSLTIHTDTCVILRINKAQATVCGASMQEDDLEDESLNIFVALVDRLELVSIVGLEKDPEMCLFNLIAKNGKIKFGVYNGETALIDLHFNPDPCPLNLLVKKTDFVSRAWHEAILSPNILKLTSKILFNPTSNLKTIKLAFTFTELSIILNNMSSTPKWIDWIADFFTVVEYPVVGYIPPAILTEMNFDIRHCTLDLIPLPHPARLTLALGQLTVTCNVVDTGQNININIRLEDGAIFLSRDSVDPVENSVCISDIDYLDLGIHLVEEGTKPTLDVSATCNLLRLRTCPDTILLLIDIITALVASAAQEREASSSRQSRGVSEDPMPEETAADIVPDLAEAMEELKMKEQAEEVKKIKINQPGAQVFFFPNEGAPKQPMSLPPQMTGSQLPDGLSDMTQSFYVPSGPSGPAHTSDDTFEDFCILDDEVGTGIVPISGEPTVRSLTDEGILVWDNHFTVPEKSIDYLRTPKKFPKFQNRVTVKRLSVLWQIFGGNDFSASKAMATNTKEELQKMGMSVYVSQESKEKPQKKKTTSGGTSQARDFANSLKTKGGPGRNTEQLLEIALHKIEFQNEIYPDDCREASRQVLVIPAFEIRDRLAVSEINKLLYQYSSKNRPRKANANMLSFKCVNLRPDTNGTLIESNIRVSLQPFRINIDQDTLFFIIDFFNTLIPTDKEAMQLTEGQVVKYSGGMATVEIEPETADEVIEDEDDLPDPPTGTLPRRSSFSSTSNQEVFIKSFVFSPDVDIRIDYLGKYFDLTHGALCGILVGLAQLNCSELTLKRVAYYNGILGMDKLISLLVTEWLSDVRQNQLPALLGGVGPMHSFLQLVQGVKDLFLLPIEQYQKDGRLIRGIQKGTNSFTSSTAMSFLDITNKVLGVVKFVAEMAYDIMSPEVQVIQGKLPHPAVRGRMRSARPTDVREGFYGAFTLVREGLDETARTLVEAAAAEHARGRGLTGAVGGVLRQMPSTMMRPVIIATSATTNVIEGVKNQVAPDSRKEEEDKWRGAGFQNQ